jgi:thiamine phosphate synthase YjbQ (UPF0047 family)
VDLVLRDTHIKRALTLGSIYIPVPGPQTANGIWNRITLFLLLVGIGELFF